MELNTAKTIMLLMTHIVVIVLILLGLYNERKGNDDCAFNRDSSKCFVVLYIFICLITLIYFYNDKLFND
jgi:hypothetical protein